jgi:hypothetical protein
MDALKTLLERQTDGHTDRRTSTMFKKDKLSDGHDVQTYRWMEGLGQDQTERSKASQPDNQTDR